MLPQPARGAAVLITPHSGMWNQGLVQEEAGAVATSPRADSGAGALGLQVPFGAWECHETLPWGVHGPKGRAPSWRQALESQKVETGLGHRYTSLSSHLATCSLAEHGHITSPLSAWFLLSARGGWSNLLRELLFLSFWWFVFTVSSAGFAESMWGMKKLWRADWWFPQRIYSPGGRSCCGRQPRPHMAAVSVGLAEILQQGAGWAH